jgi:hypothetical protein
MKKQNERRRRSLPPSVEKGEKRQITHRPLSARLRKEGKNRERGRRLTERAADLTILLCFFLSSSLGNNLTFCCLPYFSFTMVLEIHRFVTLLSAINVCEEFANATTDTCSKYQADPVGMIVMHSLVMAGHDVVTASIVENVVAFFCIGAAIFALFFGIWKWDGRTIRGIGNPAAKPELPNQSGTGSGRWRPSFWRAAWTFLRGGRADLLKLFGGNPDAVDHVLFQRCLIFICAVVMILATGIILPINLRLPEEYITFETVQKLKFSFLATARTLATPTSIVRALRFRSSPSR